MIAQQRHIGSGWGSTSRGPSTPEAAHATSPRAVLIGECDQAGAGDSRWVHARPVRYFVSTVG